MRLYEKKLNSVELLFKYSGLKKRLIYVYRDGIIRIKLSGHDFLYLRTHGKGYYYTSEYFVHRTKEMRWSTYPISFGEVFDRIKIDAEEQVLDFIIFNISKII